MKSLVVPLLLVFGLAALYCSDAVAECAEGPADTFTCDTAPPNPDLVGIQQDANDNDLVVNMLPGSEIDTTIVGSEGIELGGGSNVITLTEARVVALGSNGIQSGSGTGDITVTLTDSEILCDDDCLDLLGSGVHTVTVTRSRLESQDNDALNTGTGGDVVTVVDSVVRGGPACCFNLGISTSSGNDQVTIDNSVVIGYRDQPPEVPFSILLGEGNDTLTLKTGAQLVGGIRCDGGTDEIVFEIEVPDEELAAVQAELAGKDPAGDSITIYGEEYSWEGCELLTDDLSGVAGAGEQATFRVTKDFSDGRDDEVEVTLECNSGLPLEQSLTIAGGGSGVLFVVEQLQGAETVCSVTESGGPSGYTAIFNEGADCVWEGVVKGGQYECAIRNEADPAQYTVTKDWVISGAVGEAVVESARVEIDCSRYILSVNGNSISPTDQYVVDLEGSGDSITVGVDTNAGQASCSASENLNQSAIETDYSADCSNATLTAGGSASCTITNTVFFEGIPTLGQWGMVLMALLMLAVGVFGIRRFA